MTDESSDRISLSRRKALAGIGSIGAAAGLGGLGTLAQFSDTEENTVQFTAGGVDGVIEWNGSYNGIDIDSNNDGTSELENVEVTNNAVSADVGFTDVKPGDFGCVNFGITVDNNPAWVASCISIEEDSDYKNYEPEVGPDNQVDEANSGPEATTDGVQKNSPHGDLAEEMLTIPYYDSDGTCQFFDPYSGSTPSIPEAGAVPASFFSNAQPDGQKADDGFPAMVDGGTEYYLVPKTVREASKTRALNTATWNTQDRAFSNPAYTAPDGAEVGAGCVFLEGNLADGEASNNTQGTSALPAGKKLNFGYDWHLPFGTSNVVQGDRMKVKLSFIFLQKRHTVAPDFDTFAPGQNSPNNQTDASGGT